MHASEAHCTVAAFPRTDAYAKVMLQPLLNVVMLVLQEARRCRYPSSACSLSAICSATRQLQSNDTTIHTYGPTFTATQMATKLASSLVPSRAASFEPVLLPTSTLLPRAAV